MTKLLAILAFCVLMSLGTGAFLGAFWERRRPPPDPFVGELNLTSEQQDKMRAIWSEAMQKGGFQVQDEQRAAAQKEYQEALRALVPAEKSASYAEVLRNYQKKLEDIEKDAKRIFDDATEKSKQVLNPAQQAKYEEMRRRHSEGMRGRGPGGKPGPFGPPPPPPGPPPPGPPPRGHEFHP